MPGSWALVALSIGALALAPLLALALARRPALAVGLDSLVLVSVGGVVALHVVPHSVHVVGALAVAVAVAGLLLPIALHRVDQALADSAHATARSVRDLLVYALLSLGLFVHALFDGAALAAHSDSLALGVLAHRLPAGLALWVVVRPRAGTLHTVLLMALYAAGTVGGALVGNALEGSTGAVPLALLQAFVAGSILHVVAESPPLGAPARPSGRLAGLLGAALAVAALLAVTHGEPSTSSFFEQVLALALQLAPVLLVSFLLVGALSAFYPGGAPRIRARGTRLLDASAGMMAGLPHPLCSCTVGPLYQDLLARGTSPPAARAFLVAAPALGVPALLLCARLLGWPFLAAWVLAAAALAVLAGLTAAAAPTSTSTTQPADAVRPLADRLRYGLRHSVIDAVDHVGPWLLVGVLLGAAITTSLPPALFVAIPTPMHPLLAALVGFPLYLCAAGTTPIAAALLTLGLSPGGALALLLVGPATSLASLGQVKQLAGARAAATLGITVLMCAAALGVGLDFVSDLLGWGFTAVAPDAERLGIVEGASLLALLVLGVASLWRQGVRGAVVQVMSPQHQHAGDHAHGPGCAHDHGPPLAPQVPIGLTDGALARDAPRVRLSFDPRSSSSQDLPR